jgi:hypothetical protein
MTLSFQAALPHRRGRRIACAAVCAALLALAAPAAQAAQQRIYNGAFAANLAANPYPLSNPRSVAVDASPASPSKGDIYVTDPENHRVEKLDSEGHFILMFGKEVNKTKIEEGKPEAERNVCTLASGDECKAGVAGTSPGAFTEALYLAVDPSSGPSAGAVYVADRPTGTVTKLGPSGEVISSWGANGQMDGSGISPGSAGPLSGPFGTLNGVAVGPSGNLWVYGSTSNAFPALYEFTQTGSLVNDSEGQPGSLFHDFYNNGLYGLVVTPEDGLYTSGQSVILSWSAGTELGFVFSGYTELGQPRDSDSGGFAFDPSTNDLYVDVYDELLHREQLRIFSSSCQLQVIGCLPAKETFESPHLSATSGLDRYTGLAIDSAAPADTIYAAGGKATKLDAYSIATVPAPTATSPSNLTHTSATLNGTVDPAGIELLGGLEGCRFEWGETEAPYEHVAPCDKSAAQIGSGEGPVKVGADISGLQAGHIYHFRLVAANQNDGNLLTDEPSRSADLAFGPPSIETTYATTVSATEATLGAEVNPRGSARVRFEYGTQAGSYEHATEEIAVSGATARPLSAEITGLSPHTAYHYRAIAENPLADGPEAILGPDRTFTTQALGPLSLLDDRGWELVSPADKHGALFKPIAEAGVVQAAADGSAISYLSSNPTEADPQGYTNQAQILSARGSSGWQSSDLSLPYRRATGLSVGVGQEYRFFSEDLSRAIVQPFLAADLAAISPLATEVTPFLRSNFPAGSPTAFCEGICYRPVLTGAEGVADVPGGTKINPDPSCKALCGSLFRAASPSLEDVLLESPAGLTEVPGDEGGLYEWSSAATPSESLQMVSILPNGKPEKRSGNSFEFQTEIDRNPLSSDGSRVVWGALGGHLYLRDVSRNETVQIDANQGGTGAGPVGAVFQGASSDGSRIFFADQQALVPGAGAESGAPDIYECRIEEAEGPLHCALTDLTPKSAANESASVQGLALGLSGNGSSIYFVADGVLAENLGADGSHASPGQCGPAENSPGSTCNLYVSRNGSVSFVATLSGADGPSWGHGQSGGVGGLPGLTARVSPNGEWLAFMSQRSLTGYDNRDAVTGEPDEEVFLYHAGTGSLVCASCNPTGARPHGVEFAKINAATGHMVGGDRVWPDTTRIAASIPGWTPYSSGRALHQSRYLSSEGRLFFNSSDALAPKDSNGAEDVYEYEPSAGGGAPSNSCSAGNPSFSPAAQGCVDLISSGTSGEESALLDASESGDDVFFLTAARLASRDEDSAVDVYDARVGGGEPQPTQPVQCEGDGCQQPATPPLDATPGSLTFEGPGNLNEKPAKKKQKHRKRNSGHHPKKHKNKKRGKGTSRKGGNR